MDAQDSSKTARVARPQRDQVEWQPIAKVVALWQALAYNFTRFLTLEFKLS